MQHSRRTVMAGLAAAIGAAACAVSPAQRAGASPRLYWLGQAKLFAMTPGEDSEPVLLLEHGPEGGPRTGVNDGIAIDHARGHVYWTNMGRAAERDGYIARCDLDGGDVRMILPPGGTHTPKQLKMDATHLYWSDREGMAVMRCRLDGSGVETLVRTGDPEAHRGELARWCVGMALDGDARMIYWTQKGGDNAGEGVIRRCSMDMPAGATADKRGDIETLFSDLPEPIDLDLDLGRGAIYWTDRGDNTVSRAPMQPRAGYHPAKRDDREILVRGLNEAIGITLDLPRGRMAYTSLGGELGMANLDGSNARMLATGLGLLTGAAWG